MNKQIFDVLHTQLLTDKNATVTDTQNNIKFSQQKMINVNIAMFTNGVNIRQFMYVKISAGTTQIFTVLCTN